ncbi:MAG: HD domain-containing protein [Betaproteobacteria bacterium]|nr:HD domain-containing protein [Betaproteobacteria bacterium]
MPGPISAIRLEFADRSQGRVAVLARAVALEMGLREQQVVATYAAAKVHDIGELALPASLFLKPGTLTVGEYDLIRGHCQIGYDMVKDIDCPWPFADAVLQHHERLDGSGYPRGLSGAEICLGARVVGVCDVVSAITLGGPHRKSRDMDFALQEVRALRGTLLDGDVVDACVRVAGASDFDWTTPDLHTPPSFGEWLEQLARKVAGQQARPHSPGHGRSIH